MSTTPIAHRPLVGRTVGLYFEKPSLRTRHSCEAAIVQLGGHPVTFRRDEVGSGEREPIADIARVLSGYHAALGATDTPLADIFMIRVYLTYVDIATTASYNALI